MPKRAGFLYEWMCNKERILQAIHVGAIGKRSRCDVAKVLAKEDEYADQVYDLLVNQQFTPQMPRKKCVYDMSSQKWREVEYVRFFPDGIIHTLMVMAMQPIVMRGMYAWCCASVPGRGGAHAQKYVKRIVRNDQKGTKYVCKMDIRHYYHSVNRKKLIWAMARKIKDKKFLKLTWDILATCEQGLGIGFFICQWLANYYLEPLDRYITTLPGVKYMVRYMDDIVIFGPNKKALHRARRSIADFMRKQLSFEMKGNWQVFPLKSRPLDFVGYRFYRTHTTLRRRKFLRYARQCRRAQKVLDSGRQISFHMAAGLLSRAGQLVHCDGHKIRVKYLDPIGIKNLKEVVRRETIRRQCARNLQCRGTAQETRICPCAPV